MRFARSVRLTAEVALAALTVAVSISFERLFTDTSFLPDLLLLGLASHVVAALARRAGLSMAWATPLSGIAMVLLGTAVFYPDQANLIFPNGDTTAALGEDLRLAWEVFGEDAAPVAPVRGFVVAASALLWYGVFLADWAAFRLRSRLEAVAPATAVFVFTALMGVDRHELAHGVLFAGGVVAVFLTMRAERQLREEVWVAEGASAGVGSTLRLGAVAGSLAVVLAALLAPGLPGATADPLLDIRELDQGPETRSVLSPLVEVSTSLVSQTNLELFSVRVDEGRQDYWRMMALTTFEDEIWRRSSNFDDARGAVGSDVDPRIPTTALQQEITIAGLGNIYLPAAYEVSEILSSPGVELEYEVATGALVVERSIDRIPRGLTYTIESQIPDFSPADLPADATTGTSGGFVAEHTQLPDPCNADDSEQTGCWPTEIGDLAADIVAGAETDYERALALQNYFLDPARFTYDINVALDHDINSMGQFLELGRGYCEQFAATYAAMARSLGIPTRVAVGFTWGEWDDARQAYVVSGKHAHAWPEVYFAGAGWVVFDPTPGRSRGFDGAITGLDQAQQDGDVPTGPTSTTTTTPGDDDDDPNPSRVAPPPTTTSAPSGRGAAEAAPSAANRNGLWLALAVTAGVLALVASVPAVQTLRRRHRLAKVAADPAGRGEIAWDDALGALRLLGVTGSPDQTPHEFAAVAAKGWRDIGPIRLLAEEITALRYSADDDAVAHAVAAQDHAAQVVRQCRTRVSRVRLLGERVDPRSLRWPAPAPLSFGR